MTSQQLLLPSSVGKEFFNCISMAFHHLSSTSAGEQGCEHPLSCSTSAKSRDLHTGSQIPEIGVSRAGLSLDGQIMALYLKSVLVKDFPQSSNRAARSFVNSMEIPTR